MVQPSPHPIDLNQADTWQTVLPRSPILSSITAGWQGIYLEYHQQPAHETPDYCLPNHLISIALGYQAKEFRADGRLYKDIVPGNVAIRSAHQTLKTQAYGNAEFLLLAIDPSFLSKAAFETVNGEPIELKTQILGRDPLVYQMGLALKQELELGGQDSRLYAESMATALSVHLIRRYGTQSPKLKAYTDGLSRSVLNDVVSYIQSNLSQELSLIELAAIAHMSPHYFSSLFKQSTGLSPHQYIIQCRIEAAKCLLKQRNLSIIDVAVQVGFQSQSHFTHVFRKYTRVTPKRYRDLL